MRFLVFTGGEKNQLFDLLFSDLKGLRQVELCPELPKIPNKLRWLWKLHHTSKLNEKRPLPFREAWGRYCSLYDFHPEPGEEYCLVFSNISIGSYEPALLNRLKRKYNVRLVLYLLDSYTSYYSKQARIARQQIDFDRVYTFHEPDAENYGMSFFDTYYSRLPIEKRELSVDAFFWGSDAGRGPLVERIYDMLVEEGLRADFGICYSDADRKKRQGICYDSPIPYHEMLSRMSAAGCIVDIVGDYSGGISLRAYEAVAYGKRLLTNNPLVKNMRFYHPDYMQVFHRPKDIDPGFVRSKEPVDYGYQGEYSPIHWLERLESELK